MNPTPTPLLQLHKSRLVYPNTADNVLGRGGFGAVFKAYDTVTQEMVAVKRVEIAAEDGKKGSVSANAMAKEYKAILNLPHHRNVISVHAVLEKENERLIVMELMPDGNLAQLMKKQEFSRARICQIAIQVANGLFALHKGSNGSNGSEPEHIFHRDLKPENILVDLSRNLFKICDFGLSTTTTSSVVYQTSTCGTYNYMAPEQFELRGSITAKTDIYGLGVIMWQMLARKLPHEKLTVAEICRQVASSQQPLPYAVSETDNLSILIHRCTNSKPDQRPTLGDVVHELQRILELEHTPSENAPEATVPNIASASNSVDVDACNDGSALTSFGKLTSNPASS